MGTNEGEPEKSREFIEEGKIICPRCSAESKIEDLTEGAYCPNCGYKLFSEKDNNKQIEDRLVESEIINPEKSNFMGKIRQGTSCALVGAGYLVLSILGIVIHVWTILIAFSTGGLISAGITLIIPVVAQIYWFIAVWSATGTIVNPYCLAILGYIVAWVVVIVGMKMAGNE